MSSKTKIVVLHMKEVVYTAIFLGSGSIYADSGIYHVP